MTKLSKREKVLVSLLVIIVVVGAGYLYVITPLLENNSALRAELAQEETSLEVLKTSRELSKNIDEISAENLEKYDELMKDFSVYLQDYQIDTILSDWATASGVVPLELTFSEAPEVEISPEEAAGLGEEGTTAGNSNPGIATTYIEMSVGGDVTSCMKYIELIKSKKYITIESMSFTYGAEDNSRMSFSLKFQTLAN